MHRTDALLQIKKLGREAVVLVSVDNRFDQKPHGVYRLAQVVAGGRQELIFIQQRLLSFLFGLAKLFCQA